ncbi:MAG: LrgB family protein, partial [Rubricella sp.]
RMPPPPPPAIFVGLKDRSTPETDPAFEAMRCLGCGAKTGHETLAAAMRDAVDTAVALGADPRLMPPDGLADEGSPVMQDFTQIWVYLSASPLLHLTLTLLAFSIGQRLARASGMNPAVNPVLIAVVLVVGGLMLTGTDYATYFEGAQFVHFLLGPATVALAIPLYRQFRTVRRSAPALLASLLTGSAMAAATAYGTAWVLGASGETLASITPKSVTAPVAMGISQQLGGLPSLTAALVILTGILGAMIGPWLLTLVGVRDMRARGLALGTISHGIGTARALQVDEVAGAFSGLAMGLNALATAILLPIIWNLLT